MNSAFVINDALMQYWGGLEASFGAGPASDPAAGDAFDHEGAELGEFFSQRVIQVNDKTGQRTYRKPVQGAFDPVTPRFSLLARPSDAAATEPDYGHFFKAGGFDFLAGTYSRKRVPSSSAWVWGASADGMFGACFAGLVTQEIVFSGGEDLGRIQFGCVAAKGSVVYYATLASAAAAAATSITLPAGCGWQIAGAPAWITINGSATVHKVTAFNPTTNVATIAPAVPVGGYPISAEVRPYTPPRTVTAQAPLAEQTHTLDLANGADAVICTRYEVTIATGMDLRPKESGQLYRTGLVAMRPANAARVVADVVFTLDKQRLHAYVRDLAEKQLKIGMGPSGSRRFEINAAQAIVEKLPPVEGADSPRLGTFEIGCYAVSGDDISISYL